MSAQRIEHPSFSFELYPPKTPEGMTRLAVSIDQMNAVRPVYFSVTYGAGGSTRDSTFDTLDLLLAKGIEALRLQVRGPGQRSPVQSGPGLQTLKPHVKEHPGHPWHA